MIAERRGLLNNPVELKKIANMKHIADMGDYVAGLSRWLKVFPLSDLKVLLYEQLIKCPDTFLRELCMHLDINPDYFTDQEKPIVYKGPELKISDEIYQSLKNKHLNEIPKLKNILELDLSEWKFNHEKIYIGFN